MKLRITMLLAVLALGLAAAGPVSARGGDGDRPYAGSGFDRSDVPARVASRVKRANRALDRAEDYADDSNASSAASALGAVRRNLAAALKTANRKIGAGSEKGPGAAFAVASAQDKVIDGTVALFDGADDALVSEIAQTLDAAITGRDDLVAAIGALSADDQQDYYEVLSRIDEDVTDEIESIDDALADDTLSADAQAALQSAREKLVASQSAVQALLATQEDGSTTSLSDDEDGDRGDCGGRHGEPGDGDTATGSSRFGARV